MSDEPPADARTTRIHQTDGVCGANLALAAERLAHIFAKLDISVRAQLAAEVTRRRSDL